MYAKESQQSLSPVLELAPGLRCMEQKADQAAAALYRSTRGHSPRASLNEHLDNEDKVHARPEPVQLRRVVRFVDELELECKSDPEAAERAVEEVTMRRAVQRIERLDKQLVVYSAISAFLCVFSLIQIRYPSESKVITSASASLAFLDGFWSLSPSPLIILACYTSLVLTFSTGVHRIAYSTDVTGLPDDEMDRLKVLSTNQQHGTDDRLSLNSTRGLFVQGSTLISATALLHIPIHALEHLSLSVGIAAWCLTTALGTAVIWDAIRRAKRARESVRLDHEIGLLEKLDV